MGFFFIKVLGLRDIVNSPNLNPTANLLGFNILKLAPLCILNNNGRHAGTIMSCLLNIIGVVCCLYIFQNKIRFKWCCEGVVVTNYLIYLLNFAIQPHGDFSGEFVLVRPPCG